MNAIDRLTKFVEVMNRKFVRSPTAPKARGIDEFFGVEIGSDSDEAVCRVSDIKALLEANAQLKASLQYASAELRHAYKAKCDWNLVARAIAILERATN